MATDKDAVTSDTEGQEKPVRKQLQKASISRAAGETLDAPEQIEAGAEGGVGAVEASDKPKAVQELRKKRSHEEIEDADDRPAGRTRAQHTRKRSRDSTFEEDELNNGRKVSGERKRDDADTDAEVAANGAPQPPLSERPGTPEQKGGKRGEEKVEAMTSPKTKRSRLHSTTVDEEEAAAPPPAGADGAASLDAKVNGKERGGEETAAKSAADSVDSVSDTKTSSAAPASAFANISTTSPFGSMTSPPPDQPQTSASAFASSGFGSLAGATTSGFGALGKTSGGPAGGWASKKPASEASDSVTKDSEEATTSTFGRALGQQSGFGATSGISTFGSSGGSAFGGKLGGGGSFGGSGFGSLGGGASLSSFASGKPSPFASGSVKPARPFGAPVDEDEDEDGGEDDDGDQSGLKSPLSQESDKQDERFFAQDHETGEEGEIVEYSCRAKLYNFAVVDEDKGKKEWKERGLGMLRLNTAPPASDGESDKAAAKTKARLVMRADGSHRLILNTPVQKDIKFGAANGGPPQGGLVLFMGAVDGKKSLEMLQLKIRQQCALELYDKITELQEAM